MRLPRRGLIIAGMVLFLWAASQWWEKGLATEVAYAESSPNGCMSIRSFRPFWILPDIIHPKSDPNEDIPPQWFIGWGLPGFYRLYDNHNGELIGESEIYDLEYSSDRISWNRSGAVYSGMIYIGPTIKECPTNTHD